MLRSYKDEDTGMPTTCLRDDLKCLQQTANNRLLQLDPTSADAERIAAHRRRNKKSDFYLRDGRADKPNTNVEQMKRERLYINNILKKVGLEAEV